MERPTLYMTKGLPASGKTTFALELVAASARPVCRLNRDELRRAARAAGAGEGRIDRQIVDQQRKLAKEAVINGHDIVVDDTNLNPNIERYWRAFAKDNGYKFQLVDLLHVPVEVCAARDRQRPDGERVGRLAIYKMAARLGLVQTQNRKIELTGPYIIVDLDGTLCDISHRKHLLGKNNERTDWDAFTEQCVNDIPNEYGLSMMYDVYPQYPKVLVSARAEPYRPETEKWLEDWGIKYEGLLMRPAGDIRPDFVIKEEFLLKYLDKSLVAYVFDDRRQVLNMWQGHGLRTYNLGGPDNNF